MNRRFIRYLQIALLAFDLAMINLVFFAGNFLWSYSAVFVNSKEYGYSACFLSLSWFICAGAGEIYKRKYVTSFHLFVRRSIVCFAYLFVPVLFCLFIFKSIIPLDASLLIFLLSIPVALLINRFAYLVIYRYFSNKEFLLERVVIIGFNDVSKRIIRFLEENELNKQVIGICEEFENVHELFHYPILSNIKGAFEVCKKFNVTEIYSSIAPESNPEIYRLIQLADQNCIHFKILPDTSLFIRRKCYLDYINNDIPVISLRKEPLSDLLNRVKKRCFDIGFSFLVSVFFLSWLVPLIGLLVLLDSKGPVFFIQSRSGKANKKFSCIKFRSMKVNGVADKKQATRNDERLTRIGKFLRRTNLDEFPQFLNVLRGDMSIIGPRPHMLKHTEEFSQINNQYMIRHFLKPGITGWAQVNGYRGEITSCRDLQKRIEHDIWYLENWNMWLDIKIVFKTVVNTFKGEKNAF